MILPSNEHTFYLKVQGERTKSVFEGNFTVKCLLTNQEIIDIGLRIDAYNRGSSTVPAGTNLLNRALAELESRIVKAPSWWKDSDAGRNLYDPNVVFELFAKALDSEKVFDQRMKDAGKEADQSIEASSKKKKEKEPKE